MAIGDQSSSLFKVYDPIRFRGDRLQEELEALNDQARVAYGDIPILLIHEAWVGEWESSGKAKKITHTALKLAGELRLLGLVIVYGFIGEPYNDQRSFFDRSSQGELARGGRVVFIRFPGDERGLADHLWYVLPGLIAKLQASVARK